MRHDRVAVVAASCAFILAVLVAGQVLGDDKERPRGGDLKRTVSASEDPCQWVTAALPVSSETQVTVVHGPFFLCHLGAGDVLQIVSSAEGRNPVTVGYVPPFTSGRVFIPEGCYLLADKNHSASRLYSGFKPYGVR